MAAATSRRAASANEPVASPRWALLRRLVREKGGDVRLIVYDGAGYGFHMPTPPRHRPGCRPRGTAGLDPWLDPVSARCWRPPRSDVDLRGCMQRGAAFGGPEAARAQAVADPTARLRRTPLR